MNRFSPVVKEFDTCFQSNIQSDTGAGRRAAGVTTGPSSGIAPPDCGLILEPGNRIPDRLSGSALEIS